MTYAFWLYLYILFIPTSISDMPQATSFSFRD